MSSDRRITQCRLERGNVHTTLWIPAKDAVIGHLCRDGFRVTAVYATVDEKEGDSIRSRSHRGMH